MWTAVSGPFQHYHLVLWEKKKLIFIVKYCDHISQYIVQFLKF